MNRANVASHSQTRSNSVVTERLEQLLAELKAINAWDLGYLSRKANDRIDQAAWAARRVRLKEIRLELETLLICLDISTTDSRN